ncbi:MAG TPA: GTP-binding protein [Candidatus Nanoarchaeia archaeon]|nr:GTP-binding protein [Candidatus Nanoarchaeia archaeon]
MGAVDRIKDLEEELKGVKYNKSTQKAVGIMKAKLAQLREKQQSGGGGHTSGYAVSKSGDATVILVGFPSVGKSTLLNILTGSKSEVAAYAFTTLTVIPGVLKYKGAKIQILDVPGIVHGAAVGRGRGKEVLQMVRSADLVILLIDVFHPEHLPVLKEELYTTDVRVNQRSPDVSISKRPRGGLDIGTTVKLTQLNKDTIEAICREMRINNAQVVIRDDINADQLIDAIEKNKKYVPGIIVVNKIDMVTQKKLEEVMKETNGDIAVSGTTGAFVEDLKELIFKKLNMIRIYTKEAGKKADMNEPLIMRSGVTIKDICEKLHRDFVKKFRFARVTGPSAKFASQKLSLTHVVKDGDVVEIHVR